VEQKVRRTLSRLSAAEVKKLAKIPGRHSDGGGLVLQVDPRSGVASWIFRFMLAGRARTAGLGPIDTVSLREARDKALRMRKQLVDGKDPLDEKHAVLLAAHAARAKTLTFQECAAAYIAAHSAGWKSPKHGAQWSATLGTYVFPIFGALPVQSVDVGLVMKAVEPIWTTKPETASRVRGRIESVLDWATARGYRTGENPARWRGHLENLLPKRSKVQRVEHHAALPYGELPGFVAELRQQRGATARALEFLILTAGRTSEVLGAKWSEIDLGARLWTIPGCRMKGSKEHRIPLCERAVELLEEMAAIREGAFVFPGASAGRPLSNMALAMLLRRMARGDFTVHGFRSTFSDWCAERTNFPSELREMALAHAVGNKVEAAYRRGDMFEKRRKLMQAWSKFCGSPQEMAAIIAFPMGISGK
jgi:integrase